MGAQGFVTLARHFPDRTVVTFDPRGAERSRRTNGATESTPDEHADDLHRLISALDTGPVDIFATSGGAVNALALVARHPEQVRTLVAHEPPTAQVLPDREQVLAACVDIHETYLRTGLGPAMAKFITPRRADPCPHRRRSGKCAGDGWPGSDGDRGAARDDAGDLSRRTHGIPGRRIWPDGRTRRLRRHSATRPRFRRLGARFSAHLDRALLRPKGRERWGR